METLNIHQLKGYNNKSLENLDGEVFIPIIDNPNYMVSNLGRIKSLAKEVNHNYSGTAVKKERILSQSIGSNGYLSTGLTINGKTKTYRVSRLVALSWIPNPENKPQVNHINGIKTDNRVENLEWSTSGENVKHAWNNGLAKKQSSFLKVQEKLKNVNPYLLNSTFVSTPLGIGKIIVDQNCYRISYNNGKIENLVKSVRFWGDDFKLILHNLQDLTKEITVNGETFVPVEVLEKMCTMETTLLHLRLKKTVGDFTIPIDIYNKLYEWHFDVQNLIGQNLAISVNSLDTNPYL